MKELPNTGPWLGYVAISQQGYPAYFLGCARKRKSLVEAYRQKFGHHITKDAGYRIVKVRMERIA